MLDQMCSSLVDQSGHICTFRDCFGMFLALDPQGNFYSCQRFCGKPEYALGNIAQKPDLKALTGSPMAKKILQRQENVKLHCSECEHYPYCRGGCLYNALSSGSDIDPNCPAYKRIFGRIKERLLGEMESPENLAAIAEKPYNGKGHPLLRKGPLIELTRKDSHPIRLAENAVKIVVMVVLAQSGSLEEALASLGKMGLSDARGYLERFQDSNSNHTPILNNLYVHLTFQCQLRCRHCYAMAIPSNGEFMPPGRLMELVLAAKEMGFRQVILTGGEPLIHPKLDELLKSLENLKVTVAPMHIVLRSNFVRDLSDERIDKISRAFTKVIVSVDGGREPHDERRGQGAYEATVRNLTRYQSQSGGIPNAAELSLACVCSCEGAAGSLGDDVRRLAEDLDIRQVRFRPVLPIGKAETCDKPPASESPRGFGDNDQTLIIGFTPSISCGLGQNLYVEPNGKAFPCYAFRKPHAILGDVFEQGLEAIIFSNGFRDLSRHTVETNSKCKKCPFRYLCGGACRAWGGETTQYDLDAPPPECENLRRQAGETYVTALKYLRENRLIGVTTENEF